MTTSKDKPGLLQVLQDASADTEALASLALDRGRGETHVLEPIPDPVEGMLGEEELSISWNLLWGLLTGGIDEPASMKRLKAHIHAQAMKIKAQEAERKECFDAFKQLESTIACLEDEIRSYEEGEAWRQHPDYEEYKALAAKSRDKRTLDETARLRDLAKQIADLDPFPPDSTTVAMLELHKLQEKIMAVEPERIQAKVQAEKERCLKVSCAVVEDIDNWLSLDDTGNYYKARRNLANKLRKAIAREGE